MIGSLARIRNRVTLSESSCNYNVDGWKNVRLSKNVYANLQTPQTNLNVLSKYIQTIDLSSSKASNCPSIIKFMKSDILHNFSEGGTVRNITSKMKQNYYKTLTRGIATFAAPAVSSTASLTSPNLVKVFSHCARAWSARSYRLWASSFRFNDLVQLALKYLLMAKDPRKIFNLDTRIS